MSARQQQMFEKATSVENTSEKMKLYREWSEDYDKDMLSMGYRGHVVIADAADKYYRQSKKEELKIIDILAGTGMVGKEFYRRGYRNLVALDGSPEMLNIAKQHKIYDNVVVEILYEDKETTLSPEDTYDIAVMAGGLSNGHFPNAGLRHVVKLLRPGGRFFIASKSKYLEEKEYKNKFRPMLQTLQNEGVCTVEESVFSDYHVDVDGILFVLQKCPKHP